MTRQPVDPPHTVAVVGAGVIGASWTTLFLAYGLDVVACDPAPGAEDRLRELVDASAMVACQAHGRDPGRRGRLTFVHDPAEAAAQADFVQENASERLDSKRRLFEALDAAAPEGVVLASSSSGIVPSAVQEVCERDPGRVLVAHPFDPPHLIPLVEVVPGRSTRPGVVRQAVEFYRSVGKRPVTVRKELPGHLANRLQAALWREAYSLVAQGAATVEDVDTVISAGPALRWAQFGPFLNLHLSGGAGGMPHMHRHLGPTMEALWADFETPTLTPELVDQVNSDVVAFERELGGPERVRREREELIVELLRAQAHARGQDRRPRQDRAEEES